MRQKHDNNYLLESSPQELQLFGTKKKVRGGSEVMDFRGKQLAIMPDKPDS